MKVTLHKLIGGGNVRTNSVTGTTDKLPVVGESFIMTGESLAFTGGFRIVSTSELQSITKDDTGAYILETLNSTYKLTVEET